MCFHRKDVIGQLYISGKTQLTVTGLYRFNIGHHILLGVIYFKLQVSVQNKLILLVLAWNFLTKKKKTESKGYRCKFPPLLKLYLFFNVKCVFLLHSENFDHLCLHSPFLLSTLTAFILSNSYSGLIFCFELLIIF